MSFRKQFGSEKKKLEAKSFSEVQLFREMIICIIILIFDFLSIYIGCAPFFWCLLIQAFVYQK